MPYKILTCLDCKQSSPACLDHEGVWCHWPNRKDAYTVNYVDVIHNSISVNSYTVTELDSLLEDTFISLKPYGAKNTGEAWSHTEELAEYVVHILSRPNQCDKPDDLSIRAVARLNAAIAQEYGQPSDFTYDTTHALMLRKECLGSWSDDIIHQAMIACAMYNQIYPQQATRTWHPPPDLSGYYLKLGEGNRSNIEKGIHDYKRKQLIKKIKQERFDNNDLETIQRILDDPNETDETKNRAVRAIVERLRIPADQATNIAEPPTEL